jgi:hypothetical protein
MCSTSQQVHDFIVSEEGCMISYAIERVASCLLIMWCVLSLNIIFWVCEQLPQDVSLRGCCMAEEILFCHICP